MKSREEEVKMLHIKEQQEKEEIAKSRKFEKETETKAHIFEANRWNTTCVYTTIKKSKLPRWMEKPREDKTYLSYFVLYQAKKENPLFVGQQGYFLHKVK